MESEENVHFEEEPEESAAAEPAVEVSAESAEQPDEAAEQPVEAEPVEV